MSTHEQWIAAYLDGTLSESEQAALSAWQRVAPENMRVFVEHNHFEQQISQTVRSQAQREAAAYFQETAAEVPPPVTAKVPVRRRITRLSRWFLPLSAAAVILIGFFLWMRPQTATPGSRTPATVARIISLRGIQTPTKGPAYAVGQALAPGRLILGAGALKLALENGVGIVFEGPGELHLIDPMRAVLHSGQVVVDVPPHATGFRLDTPAAGIVDLGTKFGAKVGPGLTTDVLVFDGEVITTASAGGFPQQITEGHAVRFEPGNGADSSPVPFAPERFLRNLSVTPPVNYEHRLDCGFNTPLPPRAGETLPLTWTIHWSDETGRSWSSQLNEVRNLAEPSHILSWERSATWGRAVFR
jgi:hypothetical protein